MNIRPALPADAPACVSVLRDWSVETEWMPMLHSEASMRAFWGRQIIQSSAWVAEDNTGDVVGFCVRNGVWISALYLRADMRCGGIGRALLHTAKDAQPALSLWVFQANPRARTFYLREGYTEVRRTEGDNEEGLPDILMRWSRQNTV